MLDFPATAAAAWELYDRGGPAPEYVLPVLWSESQFNPAARNSIGCVGINQACPWAVPTPPDYRTWPASEQWRRVVTPMFLAIVAKFGPIKSGTLAYLANFLPARLAGPHALSTVLAKRGDKVYAANAGFDWQKKGAITIGDLAHYIEAAARSPQVKDAIARVYAARPGWRPKDPVYGDDYPPSPKPALVAGGAVAAALIAAALSAAAAYALSRRARQTRWT